MDDNPFRSPEEMFPKSERPASRIPDFITGLPRFVFGFVVSSVILGVVASVVFPMDSTGSPETDATPNPIGYRVMIAVYVLSAAIAYVDTRQHLRRS